MSAEQNRLMQAIEIQHQLAEALYVKFGAYIQPDGDIAYVTVEKFDQRVTLTREQAQSLAKRILERLP